MLFYYLVYINVCLYFSIEHILISDDWINQFFVNVLVKTIHIELPIFVLSHLQLDVEYENKINFNMN
jgi:hypothetical protein